MMFPRHGSRITCRGARRMWYGMAQDYDYFLRAMMWAGDAMCYTQKRIGRKPEAEIAYPCPVSARPPPAR